MSKRVWAGGGESPPFLFLFLLPQPGFPDLFASSISSQALRVCHSREAAEGLSKLLALMFMCAESLACQEDHRKGQKTEGLAFQVPAVNFFFFFIFLCLFYYLFEAEEAQSEVCPNFKLASVTAL